MTHKHVFHISHAHKKIGQDGNLPFWIAMIRASQKVLLPNKARKVLDFGCGQGKFLPVFALMDRLEFGLGVELEVGLVEEAKIHYEQKNIQYAVNERTLFKSYPEYFDAIYSQEVLYTLEDLKAHAEEMFKILKKGGFYFATMGCHIQNPLWSKRRKMIREEEQYSAYDYSLEEVAEVFFNAGFEVGLKRLPVDYFLIYHPEITQKFSNSLSDLVSTNYENKMLFSFWKPDE
ncbi:MAG: class I SAM-dependent methyltransferase [Gammaproteobacteria bacterium]|nr:class I SAM-dependent methyltransferase [Gammaproteobacteria bacterium]